MEWDKIADKAIIEKTMAALGRNGFAVMLVDTAEEAKRKVLELIPQGADVFTVTSRTTDTISLSAEINTSGRYDSVRNRLNAMDRTTQKREMKALGASPSWVVGSVHAVTEEGDVMIASASGSQLSPYAYGAEHVVLVVGAQKIVKTIDDGFKRIYEHSFVLENERAKKAYGVGSSVNKILILKKEGVKERTTLVFVREVLGF
jgi:hypothetical protein